MKLFYLINGLGPGGAERSLAELLPHLADAGITTTVVCLSASKLGVEADVRLAQHRILFLGGKGRLHWIRAFRRLLLSERPDLVHTTLFDAHIVGRLGAVGTGIPVLSSLVNTPYDPSRARDHRLNALRFRLVRELDRWTARHLTSYFHAITYAVRDAYVSSLGLPADRITVIERGRDPSRLGTPNAERRAAARDALGLASDAEVLINVARQEYQKGQLCLLDAFAQLAARRPRLVLLVAGRDGNLTAELRQRHAELGLGDRVRFLGHRTDVPDLLAASDIFVFPSLFEGLGCAVIEAMALGLPVVASDIPALREVVEVGRTGDLVEPESAPTLAAALESLLNSPARRAAYGARGMERFRERFELGRSAQRMIEMYRSLVPAPPIVRPASAELSYGAGG
jgi:glycosyltransferase involved in cell wall biosynthesis